MTEYKVGQIIRLSEDKTFKSLIGGEPRIFEKGTKAIIDNNNCFNFYQNGGQILPLKEGDMVSGIDGEGLVKYLSDTFLWKYINYLREFDITEKEVKGDLKYALSEIGIV